MIISAVASFLNKRRSFEMTMQENSNEEKINENEREMDTNDTCVQ